MNENVSSAQSDIRRQEALWHLEAARDKLIATGDNELAELASDIVTKLILVWSGRRS